MTRPDPHSHFDDEQPRVRHLEWTLRLDFDQRILVGEARLILSRANGSTTDRDAPVPLDLDTRELTIERVSDDAGAPIAYELGAPHPFLGQRLRLHLPAGVDVVRVRYRTSPSSPALQWSPSFVYSQCQPTYARALVPLPDSPSSRLTYRAEVTAPARPSWCALMAATLVARQSNTDDEVSTWEMVKPIPPHLVALACGALSSADVLPRVRVWSVEVPAEEVAPKLGGVGAMLACAEALFGAYRWGRFDLLVMPRSFPHGGMENPGLAFISPSLLDDEAALAQVVAHELAHAWTGNLVSNASLEHFFINEGFAVYAERRILEAVAGRDTASLHAALGRRDLERALSAFAARPALTRLHTALDGIDPEEALSIVPYEKGYLLLVAIEAAAGSDELDRFLRDYVDAFAWQSIGSDTLRAFAEPRLRQWFNNWDEWLHEAGLPSSAPPVAPPPAPELPDRALAARWSPLEWRWFLDGLPRPWPSCATLDEWFNISQMRSPDVRAAWLALAVESDHAVAPALLDAALANGRLKELRKIYLALARHPATRASAVEHYRRHQARYHPTARRQLEQLLRDFGLAVHVANPLALGRRPRP